MDYVSFFKSLTEEQYAAVVLIIAIERAKGGIAALATMTSGMDRVLSQRSLTASVLYSLLNAAARDIVHSEDLKCQCGCNGSAIEKFATLGPLDAFEAQMEAEFEAEMDRLEEQEAAAEALAEDLDEDAEPVKAKKKPKPTVQ